MGKGEENNPRSGLLCVPFLLQSYSYFSETILMCVSNEELNLAANSGKDEGSHVWILKNL